MILGIYGSGGQGRDVFDLAKAVNKESKNGTILSLSTIFQTENRCAGKKS